MRVNGVVRGARSVTISHLNRCNDAAPAADRKGTEKSDLGGALHRENRARARAARHLKSGLLEIRAIASRDEARGRAAADALGIPRAYGSYEALLADPEIEAIYNPLPNHLHVPLTLQAAAAGKHVLCEKPIALTAHEATQLRAAAGKVLIAEAFMVRFHPQWLRARDLVREGRIGTLRAVQMFFGYNNLDPPTSATRPTSAGADSTTSAATPSWPGASSSARSRRAASRSSTATPRSAPIASPAR